MSPSFVVRLLPVLLALITFASPASAQEQTLSPYFFVEGGDPSTDRLPLLGTSVTANIAGVIADVTVKQTYKNDGTRPIHARYVFPASTRAAVHGLTMTVGDQVVRARIREREEAKREFVAAKQAGKNAALLEQQRPNVFTMDVANVMPGQRIEVELHYSELLVPEDGTYEFIYPTVVGPRYSKSPDAFAASVPQPGTASHDRWLSSAYTHEGEPPLSSLSLGGTISAGMPIQQLVSPSHRIRTEAGRGSRVRFSLDEEEAAGGNRDFVLRYRLEGDQIQSGLMLHRGERENFFLMMMQPPDRIAPEEVPSREYVFVVDVSGSMHGFPLNTAKRLMRDLVSHLRPTDHFNVLLFSGGSTLWSPRSRPATQANVEDAIALLERQDGGGGTELLAAMRRAMAIPRAETGSRSIIVVTDGYISAEREVFAYIREHLDRANLFAFGIGSGVNRHLIEGIARAGMGEPFVVLGPGEAPAQAERFREYVRWPVLTGIQVGFEGFEAYDVQPTAVPDLMAARPIVVYGKWRGEPTGRVVVTGKAASGDFVRTLDVKQFKPDEAHRALGYLWARARVADLSDLALAGENDEDKQEIVRLGLTYGLLTRHTSFIAVHEVIRNPEGAGDEVEQPLPLPAGVSDLAVGMGMGPEPGLIWLVVAAFTAALMLVALRRTTAARLR
ncbi:MAG TPA: VIT and VWA domain-containing protein [Candidatus Eisenbacteria bacterium]|nr:VIT and VWA domain-containing protein [Candidatus Eisenbacteria bacterium]